MNFKARRQELKLTLEQVGKMCGVSRATVYKWENGDIQNMRRSKIALYAKALQISPIDIIDPDNKLKDYDNALDIEPIFNELKGKYKRRLYEQAVHMLSEQKNGKVIPHPNAKVVNVIPVKNIKVYDIPVSAGYGQELLDCGTETIEYKGHIPPRYDMALKITGDSMQPIYKDGEIVFVSQEPDAYDGQIVIADLNGRGYIKKLRIKENSQYLESFNPEYEPIEIHEHDLFKIIGVVIS